MKKSIIISYIIILVASIFLVATTDMYIGWQRERIDSIDENNYVDISRVESLNRSKEYSIIVFPNIVGVIGLVSLNVYTLKRKDNNIKKKRLIFWLLMIPIGCISILYIATSGSQFKVGVNLNFSFFNLIKYTIIWIFSFI